MSSQVTEYRGKSIFIIIAYIALGILVIAAAVGLITLIVLGIAKLVKNRSKQEKELASEEAVEIEARGNKED